MELSRFVLFLSLLCLCVHPVQAQVPEVPEPVCVGGWNIHGEYYDRAQGGCCTGYECCQYEGFKDNPICVPSAMPSCSGIECCQDPAYTDTPLCIIYGLVSSIIPAAPECSGIQCCAYEEYKDAPECSNATTPSCSGTQCCQYPEYKDTPLCIVSPPPECSGLECCQYDAYKNTPLCLIPPTPVPDDCSKVPPQCPEGGFAPLPLDPGIKSESKCRGACGPDCPDTCVDQDDVSLCIADDSGKCFYLCTYSDVLQCGSHESCRVHDDCYDACVEEKGETLYCPLGFCHCGCDWGCFWNYDLISCAQWKFGYGPTDRKILYASPPKMSGPLRACP